MNFKNVSSEIYEYEKCFRILRCEMYVSFLPTNHQKGSLNQLLESVAAFLKEHISTRAPWRYEKNDTEYTYLNEIWKLDDSETPSF